MKKNTEIVNRVDAAGLITIDIADLIVVGPRKKIDLSDWLDEGLIIREASFKKRLDEYNWQEYSNC